MMHRTKVTVACQACQKKKIKCTGSAPCTNCCRTQSNCIFTGTAKKRGPRNGNVEVINSPARRIQILKRDPNLRNKIEQMLANNNSNNHHDDDFIQRKRISSSPPNNNENINHLDEVNLHIIETSKRDDYQSAPLLKYGNNNNNNNNNNSNNNGYYASTVPPQSLQYPPLLIRPKPTYQALPSIVDRHSHYHHRNQHQHQSFPSQPPQQQQRSIAASNSFVDFYNADHRILPEPKNTRETSSFIKSDSMSISTSNGFEVLLPSPLPDFSNPLDNKKSINIHDRSFMGNNSSMRNNVSYYNHHSHNNNNDDGRSSGPIILTPLNFDVNSTNSEREKNIANNTIDNGDDNNVENGDDDYPNVELSSSTTTTSTSSPYNIPSPPLSSPSSNNSPNIHHLVNNNLSYCDKHKSGFNDVNHRSSPQTTLNSSTTPPLSPNNRIVY